MAAYEEGDRWGRLYDDAETVVGCRKDHDLLRAQALSPRETEIVIGSASEGFAEDALHRYA